MGRSVANEGFISALLAANPYDAYHFFLPGTGDAERVRAAATARFPALCEAGRLTVATRHDLPQTLASTPYHVFHLSDCIADTVPLVRLRNALAVSVFPVTGVTHSLSYARYAPYFFDQIWPGMTARDAVVATSRAGLGAVRAMYDAFRKGYALDSSWAAPRLERIPLGIQPEDFPDEDDRKTLGQDLRREFGLDDTDLVLLVFARISHYSKMDILPLLRALARAESAGLPRGKYELILAGWADTGDGTAKAYAELAAALGIRMRLVLSPDNTMRKRLFALADMFLSPVDNPQETFGLTMLEAGASGLPVVASDFDGYRDLIVPEETGFLIPTLGPAATPESDALAGVWFDNQHHLQLAQQSVVDIPAFAAAVARLAADPALRDRMGHAARRRVREQYTWARVVEQYVALWDELAATPVARPAAAHPLHPGYAEVFGGYYSTLLDGETRRAMRVQWTQAGEAVYRKRDFPVLYAGIERLVPEDALRRMLFQARKPVAVADLLPNLDATSPEAERAAFLVLWALKHDYLERVPAAP